MNASVGVGLACLAVVAACASSPQTEPDQRSVVVRTTGCGDASATFGSGVIIDDAVVVTAAHVVVGSSALVVEAAGGQASWSAPAEIDVLDRARDLAVLSLSGTNPVPDVSPVELGAADSGEPLDVWSAADSGDLTAEVVRPVSIVTDEVRGSERVTRGGYELSVAIATGDSGAGLWRDDELVGILFARSTERDEIAFAVSAAELSVVFDAEPHTWVCDPGESRRVIAREPLTSP